LDKHLAPLPQGVTGELFIAGIENKREPLHWPANELLLIADPLNNGQLLYRSGRMARLLEGGSIELLENAKENSISCAENSPGQQTQNETNAGKHNGKLIHNLQDRLLDIWAEVLRKDKAKIGSTSSFTELGGNSLRVLLLINKIYKEFGVNVPLRAIFENKNIVSLGNYIQTLAKDRYTPIPAALPKRYYPISDAQKPIFFLYQFDSDSMFYNQPRVIKITGEIRVDMVRTALHNLIARHDILRTSFDVVDDEPVQRVWPEIEFDIEYHIASEEEARGIIAKSFRPFNLSKAPLLRVVLVQVAPLVHYITIDVHHIVLDGTSDVMLMNELVALYNGESLPPPNLQYKDYAEWNNSPGRRTELEKMKEFWANQFSDEIPVLELPSDFVAPGPDDYHGGATDFIIEAQETQALKAIADKQGASLFMTLLAAYNVLLNKISGQEDIVVGTLVSGRDHPDIEKTIGMFVTDLPLRNYTHGDLNFIEFLSNVKRNALACFENQAYPTKIPSRQLTGRRDQQNNVGYNAFFLFPNFDKGGEVKIQDIALERYDLGGGVELRHDITIIVSEEADKLSVRLCCNKFFKEETRKRFASYFMHIIKSISTQPELKLSAISILSIEEKRQILGTFNNTVRNVGRNKYFTQLFREQVELTPYKIAVEHNNVKLTYRELATRAEALSRHLVANDVTPGVKVALYMSRRIEMVTSIIAIFQAGGAYVPIDVDYPSQRVKEILTDSEARIVLTTSDLFQEVSLLSKTLVIAVDNPGLDTTIAINTHCQYNPHDLAYMIYTSGTTGKPKGVMIHQLGMVNHLFAKINDLQLDGDDVVAQSASPCFDISVWQFLSALLVGGKTFILDKEPLLEPHRLISVLQQGNVTIFESVPSLIVTFLYGLSDRHVNSLPALRWMIPTGERLGAALVKQWHTLFPDIKLLNAYGPTEASDDVTHYIVEELHSDQAVVPIGRPIQNTHIYILDKHLNLCPAGVKGEICVAGLGIGKGYWKDEQKTLRSFIPNPLLAEPEVPAEYSTVFKTGDIGYYLQNGDIICAGRIDDQVKIRGFRIEPAEIENVLLGCDPVKEVVVVVQTDESLNKRLVAFVVMHDGPDSGIDLKKVVKTKLPDYMVPSEIIKIDKIPLTRNGKVDRQALYKKLSVLKEAEENYVAPQTGLHSALAEIWNELLGVERIGIQHDFFELGGHSLLAMKLSATIKRKLNAEVPIKVIFQLSTIASIAQWIEINNEETTEVTENTETIVL
jgi:amino acid adenylation domain-containing protein